MSIRISRSYVITSTSCPVRALEWWERTKATCILIQRQLSWRPDHSRSGFSISIRCRQGSTSLAHHRHQVTAKLFQPDASVGIILFVYRPVRNIRDPGLFVRLRVSARTTLMSDVPIAFDPVERPRCPICQTPTRNEIPTKCEGHLTVTTDRVKGPIVWLAGDSKLPKSTLT